MKFFKEFLIIKLFVGLLHVTSSLQGKVIRFSEDPYSMQASEQLVAVVEKAATVSGFTGDYEVAIPKKAGIEINSWNKFTGYGVNSLTKNFFLMINPEWFNKLPEDQQLFLLVRNFITLLHGGTTPLIEMIPYLFKILGIVFLILLFWLVRKMSLNGYQYFMGIAIACGITVLLGVGLLDPLQLKVLRYLGERFDNQIIELALEKTQNRNSAIKALEYMDSSIKNELKNGEASWAPFEHLFENYARQLKR